jgi:hypothetical protein
MFSMPAGTPLQKVLEAVKNFAREEFALKHRYAMVMHLCGAVVYVEHGR